MKRRILIVALTFTTLLGIPFYAAALPGEGPCAGPCDSPSAGKDQHAGRFFERMAKVLDLTEAQQVAIKALQTEEREKSASLREKKRENHQQLRQVETMKPFNENAVRALAEQGSAIETELTVARARMRNQIDAILTPEQRELSARLRPDSRKERQGGHHRS